MDKIPVTAKGLAKLEEELKHAKAVERPEVIEAIASAREHGDLKENAEYHAARERQSFLEGRIQELEAVVSRAEVIDPSTMSGDVVRFGATVTVIDEDTEKEHTYQIVGEYEADLANGRLSFKAPLAKAIIGKEVGESIVFQSPNGEKYYEILKVEYK